MKKPLIVVTGPTAVGKTALSVLLAKKINGAVVSADSMQVYKGMDIGSAKVTHEEMQGVRHYLIDILDPKDEFNVYIFKQMAENAISEIYADGKIPVIAGGTGFYIQALLYDIDFTETDDDEEARSKMREFADRSGPKALHDKLRQVDPVSADAIHENNVKRVIRALEYYEKTGKQISEHNLEQRQNTSPYDFEYFVINDDRAVLYDRINKRVDEMISSGLEAEVRSLYDAGMREDDISMKGIGYREFFPYFDNRITLDEVIENIKADTRHFAKRQLTWFRRERDVKWIDVRDFGRDKDRITDYMISVAENDGLTGETI
ncbi:MAG: tRNA (adenosine(37)-N6)-dimethylallyltransferase MiaA [Lachnospiraceae bacterium]|nr:tRNA (adenosine(37)-N6)-dimethylallyltransferase MiaA [Lachnospiraceae bacterium]